MKKVIVLLLCFPLFAQAGGKTQPAPALVKPAPVGTKTPESKTVDVLGTTLALKEEKKSETQYLAEYIPQSETFDNFTKMFAIWGSKDGTKAVDQVKAKIQMVNTRKGKDPVANFQMFKSQDGKSYGLDFLISEGNVIEHNVWYFTDVKGGVLAYQVARRNYKGSSRQPASEFIKEVPKMRNELLAFLNSSKLPRPAGY